MKTIVDSILSHKELLNQQISDILEALRFDGDEESIQLLIDELDTVKRELALTSFVNCTTTPISIDGLGVLQPSGILPRVETLYEETCPHNGIPVRKVLCGITTGLPYPVEGLTFIVSRRVLDALGGTRSDCFTPDTEDAIRNDKGQIVAVRGLVQ